MILLKQLWADEAGFIVSSEMVLIGTITVLGMIVGLTEVAFNINQELEDVGSAFGQINQSYAYNGSGGPNGTSSGSGHSDEWDHGDDACDVICDVAPTPESY